MMLTPQSPFADASFSDPNTLRTALTALTSASINYCVYSNIEWIDELPEGKEIDVLVAKSDITRLDNILHGAGLRRTKVRRNPNHLFYIQWCNRKWLKVDVKSELWRGHDTDHISGVLKRRRLVDDIWIATDDDLHARAERQLAQRTVARPPRERLSRGLFYYLPHTFRRPGAVIAVVGPDGAGKTTLISELNRRVPMGIHNVYLGGFKNKSDSEVSASDSHERPLLSGAKALARQTLPDTFLQCLRMMKRGIILWKRLAGAYAEAWRGTLVLCDRHPKEALVHTDAQTSFAAMIDHIVRVAAVPWPDASIVIDAPGGVLYARKGEHSPTILEEWRQRYHEVFMPNNGHAISAEDSLESTIDEASGVIWNAIAERTLKRE